MELTSQLNDLFTEQLTETVQWRVVPGQLERIVSSPSGYTWGVNTSHDIFLRKGATQWVKHDRPTQGTVLDLAVDSERVYVMVQEGSEPVVRSKSVSGDGSWSSPVPVPSGAQTLVATSSHLVVDTPRGVFTCTSPCNGPSWVSAESRPTTLEGSSRPLEGGKGGFLSGSVSGSTATLQGRPQSMLSGSTASYLLSAVFPQTKRIKVTSASARYVYGVDGDGKAHVYRNGEWIVIPGLASKTLSSVSGEVDESALYATETTGRLWRCKGNCSQESDLEAIGADGMAPDATKPKQFTVDGARHELWQLTPVHGGQYGNGIVTRSERLPNLLAKTGPINAQRDFEVDQVLQKYGQMYSADEAGRDIRDATTFLQKLETRVPPDEDSRLLRRQIDLPSVVAPSLFLLQVAAATVLGVFLVYTALPEPFSHGVAFIVACIGLAISFSASRGNGKP